jgi:Tfp pilus assembly protein PilE
VRTRRALTIAELVFAIGLLAVLAVVSIGFFVKLSSSSTKTADQTVALELGSKILEEYSGRDPAFWLERGEQELQVHEPSSQTTFYYRVRHRRLSPVDAPMGDVYRLDVDVYWWPEDPANPQRTKRRDYGRLNVHLSNVVFVDDTQ